MASTVTVPLSIAMHSQTQGSLKAVVKLLTAFSHEDCYAYERESTWHVGVGSLATLVVDATGTSATVETDAGSTSITVNGNIKEIVAEFIAAHCLMMLWSLAMLGSIMRLIYVVSNLPQALGPWLASRFPACK